ncbi:MAG: carbon-nitrogen hydrolase family protein [Peptococcaceae bacterium]|jgi:predicted amidohydrolase|nr:carbon-nitrogen hydrolase family protein [Peptococcaceae bacterium]
MDNSADPRTEQIRLAVVQFPRTAPDRAAHIHRMADYLVNLEPADIVLLPEDWLGPQVVPWPEYLGMVKILAAGLPPACLLVSGAQYVETADGVFSRGLFLLPGREIPFDKQFPSQAVGERGFVRPGRFLPVVEHRGVRLGAVVCVDLMYPELTRRLALQGAEVVLNPANIPADRLELWRALGLVRAAENTVFLACANNTGTSYEDGRPVSGGSFVARPNGCGFSAAGPCEGVYYFDIDLTEIKAVRRRWPYLADVRGLREGIQHCPGGKPPASD